MIRLVEIDPDVGIWDLEVEESQKAHVASLEVLLARAYIFRKYRTQCFWIYNEDNAVGMVLYYDCPERESYDFSQIFVDKRYQGRGYGRAAVQLVLDQMRQDGKYSKVTTCYVEGNDASRELFSQAGFVEISHEWDEIFMEKQL